MKTKQKMRKRREKLFRKSFNLNRSLLPSKGDFLLCQNNNSNRMCFKILREEKGRGIRIRNFCRLREQWGTDQVCCDHLEPLFTRDIFSVVCSRNGKNSSKGPADKKVSKILFQSSPVQSGGVQWPLRSEKCCISLLDISVIDTSLYTVVWDMYETMEKMC